jgi:Glyoxalase-like domain
VRTDREITFDARDPHALAAFWAALLEREMRPGDMPQDDSVLVVPVPGQGGRDRVGGVR